ncbi:MAG: hypothetical protein F4X22_12455 [Gemmatimonadales bacterium]|nr:hypothetical protein [Candidatus Palauibacter denitrificans]
MILDDRVVAKRNQPLLYVLLGTLEAQLPHHGVPDLLEPFPRSLFTLKDLHDDHRISGIEGAAEFADVGPESEADRLRALTESRDEIAPAE